MAMGGVVLSRDNFSRLLEPGLRKIFFDTYKMLPEQYSKVFNVLTSKKAIETDLRMGGFSGFVKKGTLDATVYEDPTDTGIVQYKHDTFSKGFIIEKEMYDDEQYNQIQKFSRNLADVAKTTIESFAASVFNEGFTAKASNYQGEALFQKNHVRRDGGFRTNMINTALSEAGLEEALLLAAQDAGVNERGEKAVLNMDTLVVPRSLEFVAYKLMHTTSVPTLHSNVSGGTTHAENDVNPMKGRFKVVVLDYLDDQKSWYLMDSRQHELNFFWREKLNFKSTNDFDTDIAKYKGRYRCSVGWSNDFGVIGSKVV